MGSMKSQFKRADSSGAAYAVVFGEDEMARGLFRSNPFVTDLGLRSSRL